MTTTLYIHRLHLAVAVADAPAANAYAASLTGNPADDETFSVPLSADGSEPATYLASSTVITEAMRVQMWDDYAAGKVPASLLYWWLDSLSGEWRGSNVSQTPATDFDVCIAQANLQRVVSPLP